MPPVLGPTSPSPTRLWSCAAPSGMAWVPSHSANRLISSPIRHSSITTLRPASPSAPRSMNSPIASSASLHAGGHHHALAGRQPIRLHHDRRAPPAHEVPGGGGVVEPLPQRRRNAGGVADLLGEALAALQPRRRRGRPDAADPGRAHGVGDAGNQRRLRRPAPPDRRHAPCRTPPGRRCPAPRSARSPPPRRCRDCPARTTAWSAAARPTAPSTAHARARPIQPPIPACAPPPLHPEPALA